MKIAWPLITAAIPNSDQLLVITLDRASEMAKIYRMKDDAKVNAWDLWLDSKDTIVQIEFIRILPRTATSTRRQRVAEGPRTQEENARHPLHDGDQAPLQDHSPDPKNSFSRCSPTATTAAPRSSATTACSTSPPGDGTSDSDTNVVGQDMSSLLAKVLRIDVDHPDPGKAYSVPKDNPFVDMKGARPEIWSLRLPQSMAHVPGPEDRPSLARPKRPGSLGASLSRQERRQRRLERHGRQPSVLSHTQAGAGGRSSSRRSSIITPKHAR